MRIILLAIVLLLTASYSFAQKILKSIPENLHGFWQFDVENKGDWNGLHVGTNYVERFYNLSQVDSVIQNDNKYTVRLTYPNRRDGEVRFELLSPNEALIQFDGENTPKKCKHFDNDPDIELFPVSKYKKTINGAWIVGNDVRKPFSINKNKLSWNGETWNVRWLGEYLKKEYRALLEKNNEHRLIYITHVKDNLLKVVFNQGTEHFCPMPPKVSQNLLYGTWCDPKTNEWIIGFFDNIAVYENQSWKYEIVDCKKNNYTVELQKDGKKRLLDLQLKNKNLSQLELKEGGVKQILVYTVRPKPYNYPDSRQFVDNGYHTDTVTINGYLQNIPDGDRTFQVSIMNFFTNQPVSYFADIDENGLFTIKFPVINTSQLLIDRSRSFWLDVVEPGESYFLYINYAGNQYIDNLDNIVIWQMGNNARLHREITAHQFATKIEYNPNSDSFEDSGDYLAACKVVHQRKLDNLNRYILENPIQSEKFKTYKQKDELLELGYYLMQRQYRYLNRADNERFNPEYMAEVDSIFYRLPDPYTLNRLVSTFFSDYAHYHKSILNDGGFIVFHDMLAMEYFDKEGIFPLTDTQREVIKQASKGMKLGVLLNQQGKDSTYISQQTKPYEESILAFFRIITDSVFGHLYETEWPKVKKEVLLNREFMAFDSLNMPQNLRDLIVLRYAYDLYDSRRTILENIELTTLSKRIKNPHFRNLLQQEQDKYIALQGQSVRYTESLKRTDHLKDAKDADELLKKLTEPYLGKIIHIDFWGTWCAPCRTQMSYAGIIKEAMKGKDIIFMYFANRSPDDSWKNVIKQFDLTGENVVHYNLPDDQQAMLERRLGVNSFPTYMIMDKTGKIVDMNPPMPMQVDQLVEELNKWIEK